MNKYKYILPFLLLITNILSAQYVLSRQVISNTGGSTTMAGITMDYTTGETLISRLNNGSYTIDQGFHQYFTATISTNKLENNLFIFYPNPVTGLCYLEFEKPVPERSSLHIYNGHGIVIYTKLIENSADLIQLDLGQLLPGIYLAILKNNKNKNVSSFKLIKI